MTLRARHLARMRRRRPAQTWRDVVRLARAWSRDDQEFEMTYRDGRWRREAPPPPPPVWTDPETGNRYVYVQGFAPPQVKP